MTEGGHRVVLFLKSLCLPFRVTIVHWREEESSTSSPSVLRQRHTDILGGVMFDSVALSTWHILNFSALDPAFLMAALKVSVTPIIISDA